MARTPEPLKLKEEPKRPKDFPLQLWRLPQRVVQRAGEIEIVGQEQLSKKSGVSKSVISKLCAWINIRKLPAITIWKLAHGLECTPAWLLMGDPAQPRTPPVTEKWSLDLADPETGAHVALKEDLGKLGGANSSQTNPAPAAGENAGKSKRARSRK